MEVLLLQRAKIIGDVSAVSKEACLENVKSIAVLNLTVLMIQDNDINKKGYQLLYLYYSMKNCGPFWFSQIYMSMILCIFSPLDIIYIFNYV